jgi:hypothetical protein
MHLMLLNCAAAAYVISSGPTERPHWLNLINLVRLRNCASNYSQLANRESQERASLLTLTAAAEESDDLDDAGRTAISK